MDKANKNMYTCRQTDAHYTSIDIKIYIKKPNEFLFYALWPSPQPAQWKSVRFTSSDICIPAGTYKVAIIAPNLFLKVGFNIIGIHVLTKRI